MSERDGRPERDYFARLPDELNVFLPWWWRFTSATNIACAAIVVGSGFGLLVVWATYR